MTLSEDIRDRIEVYKSVEYHRVDAIKAVERILPDVEQLEQENEQLKKHNQILKDDSEIMKNQIKCLEDKMDKMVNCENCKHSDEDESGIWCRIDKKTDCKYEKYEYWELAE